MNEKILSFQCPTKIYMGINSHQKLHDIIKEWKVEKLFVVADPSIVKTEFFASVEKLLKDDKVAFDVFSEVEPDPSANTVEKAFDLYKASRAPVVLAVGGGSTMDTGKSVGILAKNGGRIEDYEGIEKFSIPPLPLIAIPALISRITPLFLPHSPLFYAYLESDRGWIEGNPGLRYLKCRQDGEIGMSFAKESNGRTNKQDRAENGKRHSLQHTSDRHTGCLAGQSERVKHCAPPNQSTEEGR